MRRFGIMIATAALLTGCCGVTMGEGTKAVVRDNVSAWRLASQYAAATGWPATRGLPGDVVESAPIDGDKWRARYVAWLANALLLDARAQGGTMTVRDANLAAEAEVPK